MEQEKALAKLRRILDELRDVYLIKPGPEPSESTYKWLCDWFQRDDNVANGVALTPLMWLPRAHWACLAQCLKSEHPYSSANNNDIGLFVTLKATSPCRVLVGEKRIPTSLSVGPAQQMGTAYEIEKLHKDLGTNDTISLAAHWAINALMEHSRMGWEPQYWDSSSAVPKRDTLVEVGYELRGSSFAEPVVAPPRAARRKAS